MSETPYSPTEQPGDDDWTSHAPQGQPRYAASASVPPPPAPPAGPAFGQPPASGFGQPPAQGFGQPPASGFGQPPAQGFGQPPAPGFGQPGQNPPQGQSSVGQARVAASASVPAAPTNYGPPPQGYPSQAGVYGTPAGQAGPAAPAGQQYGSTAPATYGQPAQGFGQAPPASGFGQPGHAPGGPAFGGQSFQPGPGGPGGGQFGQPNQGHGGPPPGFNTPQYNQGYQGEQDRGREYDDEPAAPSGRSPKRGLIIAGLIAAVLVVVVGIGGFVGYKLTNRSADYAVGTCVLKDDTSAKVVDCATAGAYKITSLEDAVSKCPDIFQPSLALPSAPAEHRYACLAPMSAN